MNFFKTLSESGITDVIIQFEQTEKGEVTVFVSPKSITNTNAIRLLKPIFLKGSAEQVDNVFYENLAAHMIEISDAIKEEIAAAKIGKVAEKPKAKTAPEMVKEIAEKTKSENAEGTDGTTATMEIIKEDAPVAKKTTKAIAEKVVKVNHEKALKDFMATIKNDKLIDHKIELESLLNNLTEEELAKPYNAGVKKDLDEAAKKEAQKIAFRLANGFVKETAPDAVEEVQEVENVVDTENEEVTENVVEEPSAEIQEEVAEIITKNIDSQTQEEPAEVASVPVVTQTEDVAPSVKQLQMISVDYTYEQYLGVGWTNETLVANGHARWIDVPITTPGVIDRRYEDNFGGTGHGDISQSDANSGL